MASQGGGNLPPLQPNAALNQGSNSVHLDWSGIAFGHRQGSGDGAMELGRQAGTKHFLHRRSASDSLTCIESAPYAFNLGQETELDTFDANQLMSMILSGIGKEGDAPKETAERSQSVVLLSDEGKRPAAEEDVKVNVSSQIQIKSEAELQNACNFSFSSTAPAAPNMDPKRIKRIIANRQSAQRSRIKKLMYTAELEKSVKELEAQVASISPQVVFLEHQRTALNLDNSAMRERIAALELDKVFQDAHSEALKEELQLLTNLYQQYQQMQCKELRTGQELSSHAAFNLKQ